ncbi:MAG TPA: hypothetical protein VEL73_05520 [Mycobacteriales bacterium]|nr:hypothetical protein [Mycobacteriales bacterium]
MAAHEQAASEVDSARRHVELDVGQARNAAVAGWLGDWDRWRSTPAAAAALRRWRAAYPSLAGFGSHAELLAGCGRDLSVAEEVADRRLAVLVGEARAGDAAATRLVLQRVLPGLVGRAARRARMTRRPFAEVLHELVASAWLVIGEYPLDRRPAKIAVNVLWDAESRLFGYVPVAVRSTRPVAPDELPTVVAGLDGTAPDTPANPSAQVLSLLALAVRRGLPGEDVRLLTDMVLLGRTADEPAGTG